MIGANSTMLKIHLLSGILYTLLTIAMPSSVTACQCNGKQAPCEAFPQASVVFIGRVIDSAEQKIEPDYKGGKITFDVGIIRFEVEEIFKGDGSRIIEIHSGTNGVDCGYWFRRGERYLIYAYGNHPGNLGTNVCTRTRLVKDAAEDLQFLRNLPRKGVGGRIYGTVGSPTKERDENFEEKVNGMSGVEVRLHGPDEKEIVKTTDKSGNYEFTSLQPGLYVIEVTAPEGYEADYPSMNQFDVQDGGCGKSNFKLLPTISISGRLLKSDGSPFGKGAVSLLTADAQGDDLTRYRVAESWIQEQGSFKFAHIAPGRYLLAVNLSGGPNDPPLYPTTFYPDAPDPEKATIIEVKLGDTLTGYDIRARKEVSPKIIRGVVLWENDMPAINAEIVLVRKSNPLGYFAQKVKTDKDGRFTIKGGEGLKYWLYAIADKYPDRPWDERQSTYSEPTSIELKDDSSGIKLTVRLDQNGFEEDFKLKKGWSKK